MKTSQGSVDPMFGWRRISIIARFQAEANDSTVCWEREKRREKGNNETEKDRKRKEKGDAILDFVWRERIKMSAKKKWKGGMLEHTKRRRREG